jgi:hypothetical protein
MRGKYNQPKAIRDNAKRLRAKAMLRGDKTYDPGFACRNGHTALRRVSNNDCVTCSGTLYNPPKPRDDRKKAKVMMGRITRGVGTITSATYSDNGAGQVIMTVRITEGVPARRRGKSAASPVPRRSP